MYNSLALILTFLLGIFCTRSLAELTFPSSSIYIPDAGMTFYFEFNDQNKSLVMGLSMDRDLDYFGIGFANEGNYQMVVFDIIVFLFMPNNDTSNTYTTTPMDIYATQNHHPPEDTSLGGTADYHIIDTYVTEGKRQVLFQRLYDTGDKYDYVFNPDKVRTSIVMNWAFGSQNKHSFYGHHANAGTVISQMFNGFKGDAKNYFPGGLSPDIIFPIHGYMMLFGWGILVELLLQVGRYRKFSKNFILIHMILSLLLYSMTAVVTGLALYLRWGQVTGTTNTFHFYIGLVIVALCTIQVLMGLVLGTKLSGTKASTLIPALNKAHLIIGVLTYLLTKAQLGIGLYLFKQELLVYLYVYYGLIITARVVQEYKYRVKDILGGKSRLDKIEGPDSQTEKHQKLLELLNNNTPLYEIKEAPELKDLKWAVLDDKVFELKDFTHPGGNFILERIQGREIGRFIYGAYGLESSKVATLHTHTNQALFVIQRNLIGTVQNNQLVLTPIFGQSEVSSEVQGKSAPIINLTMSLKRASSEATQNLLPRGQETVEWVLEKKTLLAPMIAKFEFSCPSFFVNPIIKDIRHIGRHWKVAHNSHKHIRLYTLVLCLTEARTRRREELWNKALKKSITEIDLNNETRFENLPLVIKRYDVPNYKTFSSFVHDCQNRTGGFKIEGPFGLGFELTPESTGAHYVFAAGTGILPFLDLFDYLLESILKGGNNLFKNGFKLHLFASFMQIDAFIGLDICEKLVQACKREKYDNAFKIIIKAQGVKPSEWYETTEQMFDINFVERYVNPQCERVYVCGPPIFNKQVPTALSVFGVPKEKVHLV